MIPIRANIVGPPEVATRINASNGRLPFRGLMLCLAKPRDVPAGILERDELVAFAATESDHQTAVSNRAGISSILLHQGGVGAAVCSF